MVSKNNRIKKMEKAAERKPHFAIRKLTIGAASVLLGTTLWMSTTASTSHADTNDDANSPESHEESNTTADNGTGDANKTVVITNNDAAKAAADATTDNVTINNNESTETKAAQDKNSSNSVSAKKSAETKSSVDTSSLEKNNVSASTVTTDKSTQASAANKASNNAATTTNKAANASTTTNKSASTTVNNTEKAAAKLAEDANVNTGNITKSTVSKDTTITDAGKVGKQDQNNVDTQTFNLNTAELGKLTKSSDSHFDSRLAALLGTSLIRTNATNAVNANTSALNGSALTNGDATAVAASLRTASGNNDTSNYKTVTDWSGLQSAVSSGAEGVIVSGNISATNGFFNLSPHNDLNINSNFTIVGADKNASINLNNNVIQNNGNLTLKDITINGSVLGNGTVNIQGTVNSNADASNSAIADRSNAWLDNNLVPAIDRKTGLGVDIGRTSRVISGTTYYTYKNWYNSNITASRVNVDQGATLNINRSVTGDGIDLGRTGAMNVGINGALNINLKDAQNKNMTETAISMDNANAGIRAIDNGTFTTGDSAKVTINAGHGRAIVFNEPFGGNASVQVWIMPNWENGRTGDHSRQAAGHTNTVTLGDSTQMAITGRGGLVLGYNATFTTGNHSIVTMDNYGNGEGLLMDANAKVYVSPHSQLLMHSNGKDTGSYDGGNYIGLGQNAQFRVEHDATFRYQLVNAGKGINGGKKLYSDNFNIISQVNGAHPLVYVGNNATFDGQSDYADGNGEIIAFSLDNNAGNQDAFIIDGAKYVNWERNSVSTGFVGGTSPQGNLYYSMAPSIIDASKQKYYIFKWFNGNLNDNNDTYNNDQVKQSIDNFKNSSDEYWQGIEHLATRYSKNANLAEAPGHNVSASDITGESTVGQKKGIPVNNFSSTPSNNTGFDPKNSQRLVLVASIIPTQDDDTKQEVDNYDVKIVYDENLKPGQVKLVQQGVNGLKRTTTTTYYNVDPSTGKKTLDTTKGTNGVTTTTTVLNQKQDEIIHVGKQKATIGYYHETNDGKETPVTSIGTDGIETVSGNPIATDAQGNLQFDKDGNAVAADIDYTDYNTDLKTAKGTDYTDVVTDEWKDASTKDDKGNIVSSPKYNVTGLTKKAIQDAAEAAGLNKATTLGQATVNNKTPNFKIVVAAQQQNASLKIVDDTTGGTQLGDTIDSTGKSGTSISFKNGATTVQNLLDQGYVFVSVVNDGTGTTLSTTDYASADFGNFDNDPKVDQNFTVHLKHGYKEINKDNPDGHTVTATVTRTVNYTVDGKQDSSLPGHTQTVSFSATGYEDTVTKQLVDVVNGNIVTENNTIKPGSLTWTVDGGTTDSAPMNGYTAPTKDHYHVDANGIEVTGANKSDNVENNGAVKSITVNHESHNIAITIPLVSNGTKLVDQGKTKTTSATVRYIVDGNDANKPQAPADNVQNGFEFTYSGDIYDAYTNQPISKGTWSPASHAYNEVTSPKVAGYTPNQEVVSSDQLTVTLNNLNPIVEVHYTKNAAEKANLKIWDDTSNVQLGQNIATQGDEGSAINFNGANQTVQNYLDSGYKFVSVVSDANGNILSSTSFDVANFGTFDTNPNSDQNFTVHLVHGTKPVNPENPTDKYTKQDLQKTSTRTINYVDANGNKLADSVTSTVVFSGSGYVDTVTGNLVNLNSDGSIRNQDGQLTWTYSVDGGTAQNGTDYTFAQTDARPSIEHDGATYKFDHTTPGNYDAKNGSVSSYLVRNDADQSLTVNVVYHQLSYKYGTPDTEEVTRTINYLDNEDHTTVVATPVSQKATVSRQQIQDEDGEVIGYGTISEDGHSYTLSNDWTIDNNGWVSQVSPDETAKGYKKTPHFDNGQDASTVPAGTVSVTDPQNATVNVYYDHDTTPVTPDHPDRGQTYNDLNKDVTRTIKYQDTEGNAVNGAPDGKSTYAQTAHFTRTAIVDKVNNKLLGYDTNGDGQVDITPAAGDFAWQSNDANLPSVTSKTPSEVGYDNVDIPVVQGTTVAYNTTPINVTVTYSKNAQQGAFQIHYIDEDNNNAILRQGSVSGKIGDTVNYNPQTTIDELTKLGYVQDTNYNGADKYVPQTNITEQNNGKTYIIAFKHGRKNGTTETLVPTETVHFQYADGSQAAPDVKGNAGDFKFTRTPILDAVTGQVVDPGKWNQESYTFDDGQKNVKVINGYVADKATYGNKTATPTDLNVEDTVTYRKISNIIPVDENGNQIPGTTPVDYKNDPSDPTKVTPNEDSPKVPSGWTISPNQPEGVTPDKTTNTAKVTPVDPTQPTKVVYTKDATPVDKATVTVIYHDDTDNKQLESWNSGTGDSQKDVGADTGYTQADINKVVQGYEAKGYRYVTTDGTLPTTIPAGGATITVHLAHNQVPVGPDTPDKHGVNPDELKKTYTSTLHYVDSEGNTLSPEQQQSSTWTRTVTVDEVTNQIVNGGKYDTNWILQDANDKYSNFNVPVIKGYVARKTTQNGAAVSSVVEGQTKVQQNLNDTVIYDKVGKIVPVDPSKNPIPDAPTPTYTNDPTDPTKVTPNEPIPTVDGYTPVDPTPITPQDPTKDTPVPYTKNEQGSIVVTFHDDTTNTTIPNVGYNSGKEKPGTSFTYNPAEQQKTLEDQGYVYVNTDGTLPTDDKIPATDVTVTIHMKHGTRPVDPDHPADPNKPVDPSKPNTPTPSDPNLSKEDLQKTVTRDFTYNFTDGSSHDISEAPQTVTFTGSGTIDLVTGNLVTVDKDGNITSERGQITWNKTSDQFAGVAAKNVPGYHVVSTTNANTDGSVGELTVNPNSNDVHVVITYAPDIHADQTVVGKQVVHYVDADNNNAKLLPDSTNSTFVFNYNGKTDKWNEDSHKYDDVTVPVINGYVAEKKTYEGQTGTPTDPNKEITVVYHKVGKIIPVGPDGKTPIPDVPTPSYSNDPTDPTKVRPDEPVPTIPGMTPSTPTVTPQVPTKDTPVPYTKDPVKAGITVEYIDQSNDNAVLKTEAVGGNVGDKIDYSTATSIFDFENKGYVLVSDGFTGKAGADFTEDNNGKTYQVIFKHGTHPVNPDHPADPNKPVDPNHPDTPTPSDPNLSKTDLQKTITRTVEYQYADGSQAHEPVKQELSFTGEGTIDLVTGNLVTVDKDGNITSQNGKITWNHDSQDFKAIDGIDHTGYYISGVSQNNSTASVDQKTGAVGTESVTPNSQNGTIVITLTKNPDVPVAATGSINYIDDTTGSTIESANFGGVVGQKINYTTAQSIASWEAKGYNLVSNNFKDGDEVFTDGKNAFEVHLVHATVPVTPDKPGKPGEPVDPSNPDNPHKYPDNYVPQDLSKTVTRDVTYVYADGSQAEAPVHQEVNFTGNGVLDLVTGGYVTVDKDGKITGQGQINWTPEKGNFDATKSIDTTKYNIIGIRENNTNASVDQTTGVVAGETVTQNSNNSTVVITLANKPVIPVAKDQNAVVNYIDTDDNNKQIATSGDLTGKAGSQIDYSTKTTLTDLLNKGYELVNNGFDPNGSAPNFDNDDNTTQVFQVLLRHGHQPVNPTNPGKPGEPINPNDPDGPKYPQDSDQVTQDVTRTIHYEGAGNDTPRDVVQTVHFTASGVLDKVTGEWSTPLTWSADQTVNNVVSPTIAGYHVTGVSGDTTDNINVNSKTLSHTDKSYTVTVTYTKDAAPVVQKGSITVTVHDVTENKDLPEYGKQSGEQKVGTKFTYDKPGTISELEKAGYKVINPGVEIPAEIVNGPRSATIYVEHNIIPVTPDKPGNGLTDKDLEKNVTRTVTYEGLPTKPSDVTDTLHFTGTGYYDAVTKKWTDANGKELADQTKAITWTAQDGTRFANVTSPFQDGYHITGVTANDGKDYNNGKGSVTAITGIDHNSSDIKITVTYAKNGKIIPTDPNGKPIPNVPTPTYPTDPSDPTKVVPNEPVPEIPGMTPKTPTVTPTDPGKDTPVPYTPVAPAKDQVAQVIYRDVQDGANKQIATSGDLSGKAGSEINYSTADTIKELTNKGYVLKNDGFPAGAVFDNDDSKTQIFYVDFIHGQIPVNPDHPHDGVDPSEYTKDVKETVHYVDTEGNKVHDDNVQTSKWTRTLTVDAVTGNVITNGQYTIDWSIAKGEKTVYDQVNTPVVDGYHADKREVPATAVTQDNIDVTVTYAKNGKIIPTDPTGKPIPNVPTPTYPTDPTDPTKVTPDEPVPDIPGMIPSKPTVTPTDPGKDTPVPYNPVIPAKDQAAVVNYIDSDNNNSIITSSGNLTGKAGSTIDYSTKSTIADLENKGYVLVNDGFPAGAKFDNDDNTTQIFTVVLKHGTVPVTPDKPGKPGEPINPNDPDGPKWPEGTDENSVKKTGTQTIHYVGAGENTPKDDVQTFDFTKKMVVDKVTGKIIDSGEWNVTSHTFGYKDTPVIDGYHADKRNAGGSVVTPDDLNKTVTVTYTQNGKIIPTDPSGKPIPNVPTPTYPTDPTDPTKVTPDEPVPEIPGMTPKTPMVTPTDPGKDTPVPYTPVTPVVNTVTGKITYIDDDATGNKILDVDNFSGKVGDKIDYTTAGEIQSYVNKGYVLVSNNFKDGDEIFAKDGNVFEVHFKHGTTTVTPEKPGKPGEPIDPSNPEGPKYPAGTDEHAVKRTGTQTVHFTGAGDKTPADKKQSFDFTRKITFDNVTGKIITTTPWNESSHTFGYENVPVVDGFHTTVKTAGGTTVTPDDLDKTVTVNYSQNGKIIPVDPSGKPIPNAPTPTYPTDPTDPTKVVPNEPVPNIPGMVPSQNTVTPSDPGKDTPVVYNNGNTPVNPDTPTTPTNPTTPTTPTTPDEPTNVTPHAETPETPSEPEKPSDDTNTVKPHANAVPKKIATKTVTPHAQREVRITKNGNIINSKGHTIGYVDDKGQVHKTLPQTGDSAELAEAEAILGGIAAGLGLIGLAGSKKRRRGNK